MTELLDDTMLLAALGEVLAPAPAAPGAEAMAALHRALDDRAAAAVAVATARDGLAPVVPLTTTARWAQRGGALHRLRHPVAAAVAVAVLATSGAAAAAVATDHLPGPTRAVAFDLGLPVSSPALATARGTLAQLDAAVAAGDAPRVRTTADLLRTELAALSPSDRATIQAAASVALARSDTFLGTPSTGTAGPGGAPGGTSTGAGGTTSGTGAPATSGSGGTQAGGDDRAGDPTSSDAGSTGSASPGTSEGSGGATPGPDDGSVDGVNGGSGSTIPTTAPGSTPTTTGSSGSDDGASGDGRWDDRSGMTDLSILSTRATTPTTTGA